MFNYAWNIIIIYKIVLVNLPFRKVMVIIQNWVNKKLRSNKYLFKFQIVSISNSGLEMMKPWLHTKIEQY